MFSVIIPLYNKEHTIINTLKTVLEQTYTEYEIIIINDGSTDNSVNIIKHNIQDKRIRIISQSNAGVSAARNRGVFEASYPYIAFLDADDEWLPTYLETMTYAINKYPKADMIGCASYSKNINTGEITSNAIIDKYYNKVQPINYFINPDRMTHIGASIIKREAFIKAGGFDTSISINEDVLLQGKIAMNSLYIYVGNVLHVYVGGVKGQTTSIQGKEYKKCKDQILVINQLYDLFLRTSKRNSLVTIALKYRIRHFLLRMLKESRYDLIQIVIETLDNRIKKILPSLNWINKTQFRDIAILYIYATKCIWRLHRFPVVGQKSKYNEKFIRIYKNSQRH